MIPAAFIAKHRWTPPITAFKLAHPASILTVLTMTPAPVWRRIAAIVYDSVVLLAIWLIVTFLVLMAFGIDGNVDAQEGTVVLGALYKNVLFACLLTSGYLFFAWFWTHSGQTIGMLAWKIRIVNADGSAITYRQSLVRFVLGGISLLCLGIGHWWALFNKEKESLPDKLSHSRVISVPRLISGSSPQQQDTKSRTQ